MPRHFAAAVVLALVSQAGAQPLPTDFPADAVAFSAEALQARLAGKVFRVTRPDGNHWRVQFKDNGYFFVNTHNGFADDGRWRTEGSSVCIDPRRSQAGCSEMRAAGEQLYLKRAANGEVVRYELQ